jgi:hypothetical protein
MNLISRNCNATVPDCALRAFALLLLLTSAADAGTYTFTKIADNSNGFVSFSTRPAVNNNGTVAFWAQPCCGPAFGIYSGKGGPLTVVIDYSTGPANFTNQDPTINDAGIVAFSAFMKAGYEAILTGNGGPLVTIDDDNGPRHMMGEKSRDH